MKAAEPVTAAGIERALALCAYLVARDDEGRVYAPIMDRLERGLVAARAAENLVSRARKILSDIAGTRTKRGFVCAA